MAYGGSDKRNIDASFTRYRTNFRPAVERLDHHGFVDRKLAVSYFCFLHTDSDEPDLNLTFSVVLSSALVQSAASPNPQRRLPAELPCI